MRVSKHASGLFCFGCHSTFWRAFSPLQNRSVQPKSLLKKLPVRGAFLNNNIQEVNTKGTYLRRQLKHLTLGACFTQNKGTESTHARSIAKRVWKMSQMQGARGWLSGRLNARGQRAWGRRGGDIVGTADWALLSLEHGSKTVFAHDR